MPKLSLGDVIIAVVIIVILVGGITWAVKPFFMKKGIEAASEQISSEAQTTAETTNKAIKEKNTNAATSIARTQERYVAAARNIPVGDDGDDLFYDVVCDSQLYEASPPCLARSSEGR